jgi:hypothetical protein
MSIKLFLSCDEANHTCDKSQYNEATLWGKIKLNIHLLYCAACRKYAKNNAKLTKLINRRPVKLEPQAKAQIRATLERELAKQNH